jgi:hypothetical protein
MRCPLHYVPKALLISALGAGVSEAATVKSIKAPKRLVILNEGTKTGFLRKKKVCFYTPEGKVVTCGRVRAAKGKTSSILIKKEEDVAKITVGMEAKIAIDDKKDVKISIDDSAPAPVEEVYVAPYYVGLFGAYAVKESAPYKNLVYEAPLGQKVESMWAPDSDVKAVGLGAEVGIGISSYTLALGAKARTYSPKRIASDYADRNNDNDFEEYVETVGKGSSAGYWLDLYYLRFDWGVASFNLGNGIEIEKSVVKFTTEQLSDTNDERRILYKGKSALDVLSLRTDLLLDFKFGPVGFKAGTIVTAPLSQKQKATIIHGDEFVADALDGRTVVEDFKEALSHKATLGVNLTMMGYFSF